MSTFPSKDMEKYAESIPIRFIQGMRVDEVINYAIFICGTEDAFVFRWTWSLSNQIKASW